MHRIQLWHKYNQLSLDDLVNKEGVKFKPVFFSFARNIQIFNNF